MGGVRLSILPSGGGGAGCLPKGLCARAVARASATPSAATDSAEDEELLLTLLLPLPLLLLLPPLSGFACAGAAAAARSGRSLCAPTSVSASGCAPTRLAGGCAPTQLAGGPATGVSATAETPSGAPCGAEAVAVAGSSCEVIATEL